MSANFIGQTKISGQYSLFHCDGRGLLDKLHRIALAHRKAHIVVARAHTQQRENGVVVVGQRNVALKPSVSQGEPGDTQKSSSIFFYLVVELENEVVAGVARAKAKVDNAVDAELPHVSQSPSTEVFAALIKREKKGK